MWRGFFDFERAAGLRLQPLRERLARHAQHGDRVAGIHRLQRLGAHGLVVDDQPQLVEPVLVAAERLAQLALQRMSAQRSGGEA